MEHSKSIIEIARGMSVDIKLIMPILVKNNEHTRNISIPLFGLKTYSTCEDEDTKDAIDEALKCFFIAAEKHGKGIEKELVSLGWHIKSTVMN